MVRLRQAMAFPMYATAAWLLWVLAQQAGEAGLRMALAGAGMALLGISTAFRVGGTALATLTRWSRAILALPRAIPSIWISPCPRFSL